MTTQIQSTQSMTWQNNPPRRRKTPWQFRALGSGLNVYGRLAPEKAGRLANRLWFTPTRAGAGARFEYLLERPDTFTQLRFGAYDLPVFSWGAGPVVLFVHGWSGAGIQFGALVDPLVQAGYRVVIFDAPGHGRAQGRQTDLFEMAQVVRQVAAIFGRIHGVVAHSVGSVAAALAVSEGLAVDRLVLIAPPGSLATGVAAFGASLGLSRTVLDVHNKLLEERFGPDVWQRLDMTRIVGQFQMPGLVISDRDDSQIAAADGQKVAAAWPQAQFLETRGLGHNRILESKPLLEALVGFLA